MNPYSPKLMNSPEEITLEIFKSMFTENEQEELVKKAQSEIKSKIPGIPLSVSECIPAETKDIRIGDDYNGEPPNKHPEPGLFDQEEYEVIILGSYTPMQSPGLIKFYLNNISRYSGFLIRKAFGNGIDYCLETILYTIFYVVDDVWRHEGFHYYCDYKRQLSKSLFNRNLEEAFAVAHSCRKERRQYLRFNRMYSKIIIEQCYDLQQERELDHWINTKNEQLRRFVRHEHYNNYSLPGYRDWNLYDNMHFYLSHVYNYLKNNFIDDLKIKNNIPVNDLIESEIDRLGNRGAQNFVV